MALNLVVLVGLGCGKPGSGSLSVLLDQALGQPLPLLGVVLVLVLDDADHLAVDCGDGVLDLYKSSRVAALGLAVCD